MGTRPHRREAKEKPGDWRRGMVYHARAVIKLRYEFEDLQAASGCGEAQTLLIQLITNVEDTISLEVMSNADAPNAAAYAKFTSTVVVPRTATLQKLHLAAFLAAKATTTK